MAEDTHSEEEITVKRERMEHALATIRREGWKAAFVAAIVEAVALFLAANLLLSLLELPWVPSRQPLPPTISKPLADLLGQPEPIGVPGTVLLAFGVGVLALLIGVWLRVRRPLVERFEAVNPPVSESLRTARDAVEDDADSRMAARLYDEVLTRLRETSSLGLVDFRRVVLTLVVVLALSVVTPQVAVFDLSLDGGRAAQPVASEQPDPLEFGGLRDGAEVLGEPEADSVGTENLSALVESTGGEAPADRRDTFPMTEGSIAGGETGVESQQADFAQSEQLEEAELIRKYTVRIRESEEP